MVYSGFYIDLITMSRVDIAVKVSLKFNRDTYITCLVYYNGRLEFAFYKDAGYSMMICKFLECVRRVQDRVVW